MKRRLKEEFFEERSKLSKEQVLALSNKIVDQLRNLEEYKRAKNILFYVSFNHEVYTHDIIKELLSSKEKKIIVPYTKPKENKLCISELHDFSELETSNFKILEPKYEYIKEFDPEKLDIVIVPAIAFDKSGHRIGYGHGYYDRFFHNMRKDVLKIGLAYNSHIIDKVPVHEYDVPVDVIITEKEVINC